MKNKILVTTVILLLLLTLTACSKEKETTTEDLLNIDYNVEGHETTLSKYDTTNPVVALYLENYGSIVIELYKDVATNTVNNFIYLVETGFYDNNTFHRLVPNFVLQGGDPTGTGMGDPGYKIKGEFKSNGYENNLKHTKWVVSMARASYSNDTAGSQFFIMLDDADYLDGEYAAFGKVIDGYENIEKIVKNERIADQETGKLQKNIKIKKALVDLKGLTYEEPEKIITNAK